MIRRPPRSTRTDTLFPCTTLFRSTQLQDRANGHEGRWVDGANPAYAPARPGPCRSRLALRKSAAVIALPPSRCRVRMRSRSEEHTSELQSLMRTSYADFCLKKKQYMQKQQLSTHTSITTYTN